MSMVSAVSVSGVSDRSGSSHGEATISHFMRKGSATSPSCQASPGRHTHAEQAVSFLFVRHYASLGHYGRQITGNSELVEDSIQDLFLTICRSYTRLTSMHCEEAYLRYALRRIILRALRKQRNRREREKGYMWNAMPDAIRGSGLSSSNPWNGTMNASSLMSGIAPAAECVQSLEDECLSVRSEKVKQALGSLSGRQRQAVCLKYYEGLSNEEIACVMRITRQSVCNHLSEAVRSLQKHVLHSRLPR